MQEIQVQLRFVKQQEEQLLEQLRHLRSNTTPLAAELSRGVAGELGSIVGREFLGLPSLGRRIGTAVVKQQQKQNLVYAESQIGASHQQGVAQALVLIQSAAEKHEITLAQSVPLISILNRAQGFAKLETRITRTIVALQNIGLKLGHPNDTGKHSLTGPRISLPRLPRLATIRNKMPEVEPVLRAFVRSKLTGAFGHDWESHIQSKLPKDFAKWRQRSRLRGGQDSLDGQTFGELVYTIESIPEISKSIASKTEFRLAVGILNRSRPLLIHPLKTPSKDLDEKEFRKISLAIETIMSDLSKNNS